MQENEKVADIWKWMKKQCEVSDVLVLNRDGEISCYYVDENYPQYLAGFIRIKKDINLSQCHKLRKKLKLWHDQRIYKHAGKIRDYNITKKEWVLDGATVMYGNASELRATFEYDFFAGERFQL